VLQCPAQLIVPDFITVINLVKIINYEAPYCAVFLSFIYVLPKNVSKIDSLCDVS